MAWNVVAPGACIWRTMGKTLAAKASAASRFAVGLVELFKANAAVAVRAPCPYLAMQPELAA
jgi:hypothetical protein